MYVFLTLGVRMRSEGYGSRSVCLFVCLSVCPRLFSDYRLEAAYERYQHLQCYKGMKINVAILLKRLRSRWRENKRKSQYA